jgi:hypothetical protein
MRLDILASMTAITGLSFLYPTFNPFLNICNKNVPEQPMTAENTYSQ